MVRIPSIKLNNGLQMPAFGLGTFLSKDNEVSEAVRYAINLGYRHIDTAYYYGNEKEVGEAIKAEIEKGVVKREDIFLTTKLWCTYHEPSKVEYACRQSLKNFGLDYIDLYLMHNPVGLKYVNDETLIPKSDGSEYAVTNDVDYVDTYKAMEELVKKGLVRSIGVSNFNAEQLDRLLKNCEIKPVTNQVECHIELNQKKLKKVCDKYDIVLTAYSPLAKHNVAEKKPTFLYDQRTAEIGKKYNKTAAQVAIRYVYQIGGVPIPKSVTKSRIEQNMQIFDFELSTEDMEILNGMNSGNRVAKWSFINSSHKYFPFNAEF